MKKPERAKIGCTTLEVKGNIVRLRSEGTAFSMDISREHAEEAIKYMQAFLDYKGWRPEVGEKYQFMYPSGEVNVNVFQRINKNLAEFVHYNAYDFCDVNVNTGEVGWTAKDVTCIPVDDKD